MARGDKGGMTFKNPYNETGSKEGDSPDISGAGLYVSYDEVISAQLSESFCFMPPDKAPAKRPSNSPKPENA